MRPPSLLALFLFVSAVLAGTLPAVANDGGQKRSMSFIRDAEVENTIRAFATPIFQAAGLTPSSVKIHLVKDKSLNAFVAGGQRLFLNTGLLVKAENAGEVIGVIAHETGHMAGGHLARVKGAINDAKAKSLITQLIGGAIAIGAGRPDVGMAVAQMGNDAATRSFLKYSRTEEGSADNAATGYLDATRQSSQGLLTFMERLQEQELYAARRQDPYVRTHPVTRERIVFLREHVANSPYGSVQVTPEQAEMHARMRAKLKAFIDPSIYTFRTYKETDSSLESRYARAIAHYRRSRLDKALPLIDGLIAERPHDPYFWELKGQMLFENGRGREALGPYEESVRLLPNSALLRQGLARAQIETGDPALLEAAVGHLEAALMVEPDVPFNWHQLAIAHGRLGNKGEAALAMAEEAMLRRRKSDAAFHANKAVSLLPEGSISWNKAKDILASTERDAKDKDRK